MKTINHSQNENFYTRLCEIQELIKREHSKKNIITKVKDSHIENVKNIAEQILLQKLKICSIIDGINQNINFTYSLKQNSDENFRLCEEKIYIEPLIFYLRKHQELAYRLLIYSDTDENKKIFASFFVNYFYANSFSSSALENEFLLMLYRTLKYEINMMSFNKPVMFLKSSINYFFFKHFIHREDITNYFTTVLSSVIEKIDKLDESKELTFDPAKMTLQLEKAKDIKSIQNRKYIKENQSNETGMTADTESSNHSPDNTDVNNKGKKDEFFANYMVDLTAKEVNQAMTNIKSPQIKEYIANYFGIKENSTDKKIDQKFTNSGFVDAVYSSKCPTELIEIIFQNFSIVVELIEYIFTRLNDTDSIPISLRYICKIISLLVEEKFPGIDKIRRNAYIAQFFVNCLLIPLMNKPELCGLVKSSILIGTTKANLNLLSKILIQFSSGSFFNNKEDPYFTLINRYFIEKMEMPQEFFDKLLDVEFPGFLNEILQKKDLLDTYIYDYFKVNPLEYLRDISFCINNDLIINMINVFEKHKQKFLNYKDKSEENEEFIGAINRLCNHKERIIKDKEKCAKMFPNEKFYFSMQEIEYSIKLKAVIKIEKGYSFLPKNKYTTNVSKPKQSLYDILLNLQDFKENPIFENELKSYTDFINILKKISQLSYFSLDSSINNDWFINSFDSFMKHLPLDYRINNYAKFFEEMKNDLLSSIDSLSYSELKYIINKTRYANNNLNQFQNIANRLKKFGFTQIIRKFMAEKDIECSIIIDKTEDKESSVRRVILIKPKDEMLNLKLKYLDEFIFEKQKNSDTISKITDLIRRFPSFKYLSPERKFYFQKEYKVPNALNSYLNICLYTFYSNSDSVKKFMPKAKKSKQVGMTELIKQVTNLIQHEEKYKEIRSLITTYLMNKLYNHLFPIEGDKNDHLIYINCKKLAWIQFEDLINFEDYTLENLKSVVNDKIKKLDDYKCPNAKLKFLKEVRESITKTLSLLNKEDDLQKLIIKYLIYFIIGIIPKKLYSNIQYILLYANFEYNNVDKQIFEHEYNIVINYICNPTETFLISKITKDKFNQLCADAEAEINLSKINENSSYTNNSMSKRSESYYN